MKKRFIPVALLITLFGSASFAQTASKPPAPGEKSQNIIIRKKGDTKEKTTIVIEGNKVTINGKPMDDYKDGDIQVIQNNDMDMDAPLIAPLPPLPPHGGANMFTRNFTSSDNKAFLGVASSSDDGGATIETVSTNSPAEKAGLQKGDVITKVGSTNIDDADDLIDAIGKYKPADKITIVYERDGKEKTATAILDKNKQMSFTYDKRYNNLMDNKMIKDFVMTWDSNRPELGVRAQDMENSSGVKVLELNTDDSPAAKAGLKQDDVITSVNGKNVTSIKDIRDALKDVKPGDTIALIYQRAGASQTASVHFPKPVETSDL